MTDLLLRRDGPVWRDDAPSKGQRVPRVIIKMKRSYRRHVPAVIRQSPVVRSTIERVLRYLPHNAIYDEDYYRLEVHDTAAQSARMISRSILAASVPRTRTVVDVGCGTGALLEELRAQGCEVCGLEYSDAALAYCRTRKLRVLKCNFETDQILIDCEFDVAVSMEVAEHLPEEASARFVDLLCGLADTIVFTAAAPGQGGTDHVNEQPASYWMEMFESRGFRHETKIAESWRAEWRLSGTVQRCYYQNLMVFRRESRSPLGIEVIHPGDR